jgi:hypothetical protein
MNVVTFNKFRQNVVLFHEKHFLNIKYYRINRLFMMEYTLSIKAVSVLIANEFYSTMTLRKIFSNENKFLDPMKYRKDQVRRFVVGKQNKWIIGNSISLNFNYVYRV